MLKKYLLLLLFSIHLFAKAGFKEEFINYFPKAISDIKNFGSIVCCAAFIARNLYCYKKNIRINNTFQKINVGALRDAPEDIIKWCKFILLKYEIPNYEIIRFKIVPNETSPWSAFKDYILIDEKLIEELKILIKNNDTKLNYHEFALLHEIGHILSKDSFKDIFSQISLIPGIIFSILFENFLSKILGNSKSYKIAALKSFISMNLILPSMILTIYIQTQISRYKENKADEFAIKKLISKNKIEFVDEFKKALLNEIKDLDRLIGISRNDLYREICKRLIEKKGSPENVRKEEIISRLSRYNGFFVFRDLFIHRIYKMAGDKILTFENWIKSKPYIIRFLHWTLDKEHYYPQDRIDSIDKLIK